jgi:hypothetical protein
MRYFFYGSFITGGLFAFALNAGVPTPGFFVLALTYACIMWAEYFTEYDWRLCVYFCFFMFLIGVNTACYDMYVNGWPYWIMIGCGLGIQTTAQNYVMDKELHGMK